MTSIGASGARVAVAPRVLVRERLDGRDGELVALSRVPAVDERLGSGGVAANERDRLPPKGAERVRQSVGLAGRGPAADELASARRAQQPDGREHSGPRRHDHRAHRERVGHRARVERTGATERDQRELARVNAALDGHRAHRALHRRVDDGNHTVGRDSGPVQRRASRGCVQ